MMNGILRTKTMKRMKVTRNLKMKMMKNLRMQSLKPRTMRNQKLLGMNIM